MTSDYIIAARISGLPYAFTDASEVPVLVSLARRAEDGHRGCAAILIERLAEEAKVHGIAGNCAKEGVMRAMISDVAALIN